MSSYVITRNGIHTLRIPTAELSPTHVCRGSLRKRVTSKSLLIWSRSYTEALADGLHPERLRPCAIDAGRSCNYSGLQRRQVAKPSALANATASDSSTQIRLIANARPFASSTSTSVPLSRTSAEATSKGVGVKCRVV